MFYSTDVALTCSWMLKREQDRVLTGAKKDLEEASPRGVDGRGYVLGCFHAIPP